MNLPCLHQTSPSEFIICAFMSAYEVKRLISNERNFKNWVSELGEQSGLLGARVC